MGPTMPRVISQSEHGAILKHRYTPIYVASLLLIFHTYLVAFINSSFLEQFISTQEVGAIYIISSGLTVIILLFISRVLHKVGNVKLTLALLVINALAVFGMGMAETLRVAVPLTVLHLIIVTLIMFNLDVFMEEHIGNNEGVTGSRRGLLMALMGITSAISPFISSELIDYTGASFSYPYFVSALTLLPIIVILLIYFKDFTDPPYTDIKAFEAIRGFWIKKDTRAVFTVHFVLQMFFMCMVVFAPLYLIQQVGLSWAQFGIIMFFGQLAYVSFEYPIGIVADKYIGEQEMMALGLMIMAIGTAWISFVTVPSVLLWSVIMFVVRIGASFVEVTTEVHFFKNTNSSDAQIISFFRVTRPLAYIAGAVLASLSLLYLPFNLLFVVFAAIMIPAMFVTLNIVDSK